MTIASTTAGVSPVAIPVTLVVQGTQTAGTVTAVVNAGSFQAAIAPATWISIFGTNLSALTYSWQASDFVNGMLPTSLEGVSVTIDGLPAYIGYISPTQINVLAPDDTTVGPVQVQVTTAQQPSNAVTVQESQFSPAFLTFNGTYVAALHADYSLVGAPNLLPGVTTTPAQPGETILIYGVGFGPANPPQPTGQLVTAAAPLANPVTFTIGGQAAQVQFAGLVESGLYQFNVTVPALPNGDAAVVANISAASPPRRESCSRCSSNRQREAGNCNLPFAPNRMAADSDPPGGFEVRQEFRHLSLVFREAHEASDGVNLTGTGTAPLDFLPVDFAVGHAHGRGPATYFPKIDGERPRTVECAQGTDAVADASEENRELGPASNLLIVFQLRRREELDADLTRGRTEGSQIESRGFDGYLRWIRRNGSFREMVEGEAQDALQFRLTTLVPKSVADNGGKGAHEIGEDFRVERENMQIEME